MTATIQNTTAANHTTSLHIPTTKYMLVFTTSDCLCGHLKETSIKLSLSSSFISS